MPCVEPLGAEKDICTKGRWIQRAIYNNGVCLLKRSRAMVFDNKRTRHAWLLLLLFVVAEVIRMLVTLVSYLVSRSLTFITKRTSIDHVDTAGIFAYDSWEDLLNSFFSAVETLFASHRSRETILCLVAEELNLIFLYSHLSVSVVTKLVCEPVDVLYRRDHKLDIWNAINQGNVSSLLSAIRGGASLRAYNINTGHSALATSIHAQNDCMLYILLSFRHAKTFLW